MSQPVRNPQPRSPEGFECCRTGTDVQTSHLIVEGTHGDTLCGLTRFGNSADMPIWKMSGGETGHSVVQRKCYPCWDQAHLDTGSHRAKLVACDFHAGTVGGDSLSYFAHFVTKVADAAVDLAVGMKLPHSVVDDARSLAYAHSMAYDYWLGATEFTARGFPVHLIGQAENMSRVGRTYAEYASRIARTSPIETVVAVTAANMTRSLIPGHPAGSAAATQQQHQMATGRPQLFDRIAAHIQSRTDY